MCADLFRVSSLSRDLPDVSRMRAFVDKDNWYFSLHDVYTVLENTSGQAHVALFAKKQDCISSHISNREWNQLDAKWESVKQTESCPMIPEGYLPEISLLIVNRTRKSLSQKQDVLRKLNVSIPDANVKVPIECSVLDIFTKTCPFKVETQYRLGKYKIDAFIPRLKIAIQIDENNHSGYSAQEEKDYDSIIRDHGIVCIRFVPDIDNPLDSALKLVNTVWQRTLSPDFSNFKNVHTLA